MNNALRNQKKIIFIWLLSGLLLFSYSEAEVVVPVKQELPYKTKAVSTAVTVHSRADLITGLATNLDLSADPIRLATTAYPQLPSGYTYLRRISIANNSLSDVLAAGYQMSVTLDHASLVTASKSLANGNDIRIFYNNSGVLQELDRVTDTSSGWNQIDTKIWFKTQAQIGAYTTDDNYFLVYGNPNATSPLANGENIFEFYDDFAGSVINTAKWAVRDIGGNISQNNKLIIANGISNWGQTSFYSSANMARAGLQLLVDYKPIGTSGSTYDVATIIGFKDSGPAFSYDNFIYATYFREFFGFNGTVSVEEDGNEVANVGGFNKGVRYYLKIELKESGAKYYLSTDGGKTYNLKYDSSYSNETLLKVGYDHYEGNEEIYSYKVAKYVSPEPSSFVDNEVSAGGTGIYRSSGTLVSRVIDTGKSQTGLWSISWESAPGLTTQPNGTEVKFQVATSSDGSSWSDFVGPVGTPNRYFTAATANLGAYRVLGRYFKYKAYFSSTNNNFTPTLHSVTLNYYAPNNYIESTERVSVDSNGTQANAASDSTAKPSISNDGRYVAFSSSASNLVAGDTNGAADVFRKDTQTGQIIRVSTDEDGGQFGSASTYNSISADGRYVDFSINTSSFADNVFRKDTQTGQLIRISTASDGTEGNGVSTYNSISADGRYVAFLSNATNLVGGDTNGVSDVFRKDTQTSQTIRVSTAEDGSQANGPSNANNSAGAEISADGRYVTFASGASNLVTGDTNERSDVFRKDIQTGDIIRISTASDGTQANDQNEFFPSSMSSDGRYVVFVSYASNLSSNDTNTEFDVFRKDVQTGVTELVSVDLTGTSSYESSWTSGISSDGRYVTFSSDAHDLVNGGADQDVDWNYAIFLRDMQLGTTYAVSTDSSGYGGNDNSRYSVVSENGRYVAYTSIATNLVSNDTNAVADIFLSKVDTTAPASPTVTSSSHSSSNSYYKNNDPALSFISTDAKGISGYSYSLDQSATTEPDTVSEGSATTKNYSNIDNGSWYFHVRAVDYFGNWGDASHFKINIETNTPTISSLSAASLVSGRWQNDISWPNFSIAANDSGGSGIKDYLYYWGVKSGGILSNQSNSNSIKVKAYQSGTYYFRVRARDNAGNESLVKQFIFKFDNEKPSLSAKVSSRNDKIAISYSAKDRLSGLDKVYIFDGEKLLKRFITSSGSYKYKSKFGVHKKIIVKAVDRAGNIKSITRTIGN